MTMLRSGRCFVPVVAGLSVVVLLACVARLAGQASGTLPAKATQFSAPFRAGERLEYRVQWLNLLNAATVRLAITERRAFHGREAWHFQARAHTIEPMRYLYVLDDQFDSYTESVTLASLQYEVYLREQGKSEDSIYRLSTSSNPAPGVGAQVRVLPGTRDPLGFLYYLRAVDWQRTREVRSPVFDGKKIYDVRAQLATERGQVRVPAGNYVAARIQIRAFERGREVAQTRFWIWLAHDSRRTPVLMEAEVPFGTARVELTAAR